MTDPADTSPVRTKTAQNLTIEGAILHKIDAKQAKNKDFLAVFEKFFPAFLTATRQSEWAYAPPSAFEIRYSHSQNRISSSLLLARDR